MGLKIGFSACSCPETPKQVARKLVKVLQDPPVLNPEPDPYRFRIDAVEQYDQWLIALVHYPDCTTFDGRKLLVFRNFSESQLRQTRFLDPHFCDSDHDPSPFARFRPTEEGLAAARALIQALS